MLELRIDGVRVECGYRLALSQWENNLMTEGLIAVKNLESAAMPKLTTYATNYMLTMLRVVTVRRILSKNFRPGHVFGFI